MLAFGEPLTSFADSRYASVTAEFDIGETRQEMHLVPIPRTGGVAAGRWPPCPSPVRAMKRAHGHAVVTGYERSTDRAPYRSSSGTNSVSSGLLPT